MTAQLGQLGSLAPPWPQPCQRCGFAPASARIQVGPRRVCLACANQLQREAQPQPAIWPAFYVFASGLIFPAAPAK